MPFPLCLRSRFSNLAACPGPYVFFGLVFRALLNSCGVVYTFCKFVVLSYSLSLPCTTGTNEYVLSRNLITMMRMAEVIDESHFQK